MTYRGCIKNGVAVLDTPLTLPDGTRVSIEVEPAEAQFWSGKTIEELAHEQGLPPAANLADLAMDWPPEDSVDEFLALLREVRH
jgi:hypothetical protein